MKPKAPGETVIAKTPPPVAEPETVDVPEIVLVRVEKSMVPKPRPKPVMPATARVVVAAVPSKLPEPNPPVAGSDCPAQLAAMKVSFDLVTERVSSGACEVRNPVQLKSQSVGGESVVFPDKPTVTCAFAVKFATG